MRVMSLMSLKYSLLLVVVILVGGCSSDRATKPVAKLSETGGSFQLAVNNSTDRLASEALATDSLALDSSYDQVTGELLERARQHYQTALDASSMGDSAQSVTEFEFTIDILNELGYYPNIDNNRDFNDLSRSVIEDYEKYIASIDSLSPQTSIFALRQKLNQIDDAGESADRDAPRKIITSTSVPLIVNGHVEQYIRFFSERGRVHFERWLYLSGKYFPHMRKTFREEGVPEDLIYLSMIESGLNPVARSWAKAVGLWQFMKGTGQMYGLRGNAWQDERRDFEKATNAAARHLRDLHAEFGDWYLALAAYNSGAGRVRRAIRKSGSTDFWKMRPFLPRETRNYVPQYLAAAVMTLDQSAYGFNVTPADSLAVDRVIVNECISLTVLARCAGTTADVLRELNPELLHGCTPPGVKAYSLRVPAGSSATFTTNYSSIPDDEKRDWVIHMVRKRESLASIAKKYGVTSALLAEVNDLSGTMRVRAGKSIVVPVPASVTLYSADKDIERPSSKKSRLSRSGSTTSSKNKEKMSYTIKKGDTLGKIAELYDVRVSDLRLWNDIPYGTNIMSGNVLTIWEPRDIALRYTHINELSVDERAKMLTSKDQKNAATKPTSSSWIKHKVKAGDNLSLIAKKYAVETEDVKKWNGLTGDVVKLGDVLEISPEENVSSPARPISAGPKESVMAKKTVSYTVKKGDTLHSISSTFGIPIERLRSLNNIRGTRIQVGQEILITS